MCLTRSIGLFAVKMEMMSGQGFNGVGFDLECSFSFSKASISSTMYYS
jgi:hypothetical protein